jgi:hypothetical protein
MTARVPTENTADNQDDTSSISLYAVIFFGFLIVQFFIIPNILSIYL